MTKLAYRSNCESSLTQNKISAVPAIPVVRQILGNILAFVDILIDAKQLDGAIVSLKQLPNLEEVYQVAGGGCNVVSIVSATDIEEFRDVLKNKIMKIKGVRETMASVSLASYKRSHSTLR